MGGKKMGLFGFGKKWDEEKDRSSKSKMRALFDKAVEDGSTYQIVYAFNVDVSNMNYVVARKTTYTYKSIIIGFRESDMSLIMLDTVPEFDLYAEPKKYTPDNLKKVKKNFSGEYCLYKEGGMMADYDIFSVAEIYDDEELFAYLKQTEELKEFDEFWKHFTKACK